MTAEPGADTPAPAPWVAGAPLRVAGGSLARVDAPDKVTGRAQYSSDVHPAGMLYALVLRSPHPHACVRSVDVRRAETAPGVRAVIHRANTPAIRWYADGELFAQTVRFVGDEVAAVAADSEAQAEDALRLITVAYEPVPFAIDLDAALAPGAPRVRPEGNRGEPELYDRGDVAEGMAAADVVIEQSYTTQVAVHNALEAHGSVAWWEGDRLTLWDSTQGVFAVQGRVAEALGLGIDQVRVVMDHMGGGFGAKQIAWKHSVLAALLSRASGRPVRLVLDRRAENLAVGNRNATRQRVRIGARRDGTITAIDARIQAAIGAYDAGGESSLLTGPYQRLYRCANVHTEQVGVYTNTGPAVAFRAPGHVEAAFGLESAMDELARALALEPVELRRRNYAERDQVADLPYSTPESLRLCYERAAEAFAGMDAVPAPEGARRGVGFAAHDWGGSGHPPAYAWIKLNADGTVDVVTSTQDLGTGTRTGLTMIAAEALGFDPADVRVHLGDTTRGPYAPTSNGSTTLASMGPAVRAAAEDARRELIARAAEWLHEPSAALTVAGSWIVRAGDPGEGGGARLRAVAEVTGHIAPHMVQGFGAREPNAEGVSVRTFGAQFVEVAVDETTGRVSVLRIAAAHDCGRIVNAQMVESQVAGGVMQGLGFALLEERIVDAPSGVPLNANLEDYRVATVADAPAFAHAHLDIPDVAANHLGAKGIGEPPLVPTAPAIVNAVHDAIGVRMRDLPVPPRRVLDALAAATTPPAAGPR